MTCWRFGLLSSAVLLPSLVLFTLTTCGKDSPTTPQPPPQPPPVTPIAARIEVTPSTATLNSAGQTIQLTVRVFDQNNAHMGGAVVTWTSGDLGIATVSTQGLVTAVKNGATVITARSGSASGTAGITVAQTAAIIEIEPETATLESIGQTVQLIAKVLDQGKMPVADTAISWQSSNAQIATVSDRGLVTAVKNGEAVITARSGNLNVTANIKVSQVSATIMIEPATLTLAAIGETAQLVAEVLDRNEHPVPDAPVTWESGDTAIATVDDKGLVSAVMTGDTRITARSGEASVSVNVFVLGPDSDRNALTAIYNALDGSNWRENTNWLSDTPLEDWFGITTDAEGRVTTLNLGNNNLSGTIPNELGYLIFLEGLALDGNRLSGEIPPELGQLMNLTHLYLFDNQLTGPIPPELGNLINLLHLCLDRNQLSGPVPPELGRLARLNWLHLHYNFNLAGTLPEEFLDLNLEALLLHGTRLCVSADPVFQEWLNEIRDGRVTSCGSASPDREALVALYHATDGGNWANNANWLSERPLNQWHGVTADSGGHVIRLDLGNNGLKGTLPVELGQLSNLSVLSLEGNHFIGSIPPELGQLGKLERLILSGNALAGPIPPELGRLSSLRELSLFHTSLSSIPAELGQLTNLRYLYLYSSNLSGSIPPELGQLENLVEMEMDHNRLTGPIPLQLGRLGKLKNLSLHQNRLSGSIPPELGQMENLAALTLDHNQLTGPIPSELSRLGNLESMFFAVNQLSGTIPTELGQLSKLKELSLGRNNLSGEIPPALGQLSGLGLLYLAQNRLTGMVPSELGDLANLGRLDLSVNRGLTGPLPPALTNLSALTSLKLNGTQLCVPDDETFQTWLDTIQNTSVTMCMPDEGTDEIELAERAALTTFYNTTNGPGWRNDTNWLGDQPLEQWYGVTTDTGGRVTRVELSKNTLSGRVPPELGQLENLTALNLDSNGITHEIPPELGELSTLETMNLGSNQLTGNIPHELGQLENLTALNLDSNGLTGKIPPELGGMSSLENLRLGSNQLTGNIPHELGQLKNLKRLGLQHNPLSGPIPLTLIGLALESFDLENTELCVPPDEALEAWLESIPDRRGAGTPCPRIVIHEKPAAYLTQATQSLEYPVPLVAGESALLRVFFASDDGVFNRPGVRAAFYHGDVEVHSLHIPSAGTKVSTLLDESSLKTSANAVVPGHVIRPGLEMVVEYGGDDAVGSGPGISGRIPETGAMAVNVQSVPTFDLTLVPLLLQDSPDYAFASRVEGLTADDDLFRQTRDLLPVHEMNLSVREPVFISRYPAWSEGAEVLGELEIVRTMDGASGYYMGIVPGGAGHGLAFRPGVVTFSGLDGATIAHELGHNLSLGHTPCYRTLATICCVDPGYPYANGSIGAWGYDFRLDELVHPDTQDLMGYCGPGWISDYHFSKALAYRVEEEETQLIAASSSVSSVLLLWGGLTATGELLLEPAFVVDAASSLPMENGPYHLVGMDRYGNRLFDLRFAMPEAVDGDGGSAFAFTLPVREEWAAVLSKISLSGPEGLVEITRDGERFATLLLDRTSGMVRGILRDWPEATTSIQAARRVVPEPGLDMLISGGIPDPADWK